MKRFVATTALGVSVGLRSQTAWAVLSIARRRGARSLFAGACALGEFAADLSPRAPDRTAPLPLIARVIIGGRVAYAIGKPGSRLGYAAVGGLAALGGAYAGLAARNAAAEAIGPIPAAIIEDAIAVALAAWAVWNVPK
jgi:uncharacterized membrane protein